MYLLFEELKRVFGVFFELIDFLLNGVDKIDQSTNWMRRFFHNWKKVWPHENYQIITKLEAISPYKLKNETKIVSFSVTWEIFYEILSTRFFSQIENKHCF